MDANIVEIWLRKDPVRWISGALAGALAGAIAMAFAMALANGFGLDPYLPLKVPALPLVGNGALEMGMNTSVILKGAMVHEVLCLVLGVLYAHFTGTNAFWPLLGVGLTWGAFSWIFLNNLFFPAWRVVFVADVSAGAAFFVCLVFGVALTSVSLFDRLLRR